MQVATVDGMVDLKIPAGTQPGTTLVMAKRGVPRLGSSTVRGDHQVRHCVAATNVQLCSRSQCTDVLCGQALLQQLLRQVHVRVTIPSRLGKDEQRLVEELREMQGSKVKAGSRWGL